jgi:hypothetical protein
LGRKTTPILSTICRTEEDGRTCWQPAMRDTRRVGHLAPGRRIECYGGDPSVFRIFYPPVWIGEILNCAIYFVSVTNPSVGDVRVPRRGSLPAGVNQRFFARRSLVSLVASVDGSSQADQVFPRLRQYQPRSSSRVPAARSRPERRYLTSPAALGRRVSPSCEDAEVGHLPPGAACARAAR